MVLLGGEDFVKTGEEGFEPESSAVGIHRAVGFRNGN